jgi:D-aspartate ligase
MTATSRRVPRQWRTPGRRGPALELDTSVPALVIKVGQYPVASGVLGAVRTLGRAGIPVFALTEPGLTPAGVSRYCAGRFTWRATSQDRMSDVAKSICDIGSRIGTKSVIVPLDDESAVLVDEHAAQLSEFYLCPPVSTGLPRRLASKEGLRELCEQFGVPAPKSAAPSSAAELARFVADATFPVVAKNAGVWSNRNATSSSVGASSSGPRLIFGAAELAGLSRFDELTPAYVVQEYIPKEYAEDWIVHLYADGETECPALFTGRKIRSWPPVCGVTACGISAANPALAEAAARFCESIGYRGVADMDWRLDLRDGQYKLLDFNPRVGNNFRLFVNEFGLDVVHALHLDLTGRSIPRAPQVNRRRLVVEHIDIPARLGAQPVGPAGRAGRRASRAAMAHASTEYAWYAADDPLPLLALLTRAVSLFKIVRQGVRSRRLTDPGHRASR